MQDYLQKLFRNRPDSKQTNPDRSATIRDENLDAPFSITEIKTAVISPNNSKNPCSDKLIAEVFKTTFDLISPLLVKLFNKILEYGHFPEDGETVS